MCSLGGDCRSNILQLGATLAYCRAARRRRREKCRPGAGQIRTGNRQRAVRHQSSEGSGSEGEVESPTGGTGAEIDIELEDVGAVAAGAGERHIALLEAAGAAGQGAKLIESGGQSELVALLACEYRRLIKGEAGVLRRTGAVGAARRAGATLAGGLRCRLAPCGTPLCAAPLAPACRVNGVEQRRRHAGRQALYHRRLARRDEGGPARTAQFGATVGSDNVDTRGLVACIVVWSRPAEDNS